MKNTLKSHQLHTPKMPRKLKKWYNQNLKAYLFCKSALSFSDFTKMDKLYSEVNNV